MAGNLGKPIKPKWADGAASYTIEPSAAKKLLGWLASEKPPFQWMNWLFLKIKEWIDFGEYYRDVIYSILFRSDAAIGWDGADITFTQDIEIIFKVGGDVFTNTIALADSPLSLADGDVVVAILDNADAALALQGVYANIVVREYCIEPEANLTTNTDEHEIILFRRRGTNLEIPVLGQIISTGSSFTLGQSSGNPSLVPVGSIIPFYDFNATATFDTDHWQYCDGQNVSNALSALNGQATPDMSNRYLVGFGTEGGGDIDVAAWNAAAIGNASHQINIQHAHTMTGHIHTMPTHIHTMPSHIHNYGTLYALIGDSNVDPDMLYVPTADTFTSGYHIAAAVAGGNVVSSLASTDILGNTGSTDPGDTNSTDPGDANTTTDTMNNQLSATESIQPRSIRVRFIMRIL